MCDECIKLRTIARLEKDRAQTAADAYTNRRGGKIGSISVADAVAERDTPTVGD